MSGAQTSPFPNQNELMQANAQQLANYYAPERNRLFIEDAKQQLAGRETEMMARASQGLLGLGDEAKMAAAYPETVRYLQSQGFAKNAPLAFPGKAVLERMVSVSIPAEKQYQMAGVRNAANALSTSLTGSTGTAPAAPAGDGTYAGSVITSEGTGKNPRSSATGVGQFIDSTWQSFATAHPQLFAGKTPEQVMAMRADPALGAVAVDWLATQNAPVLQRAGVTPTGQSLNLAHYLGAGPAAAVMQAPEGERIADVLTRSIGAQRAAQYIQANPELGSMTAGALRGRYANVPNPAFIGGPKPVQVAGPGAGTTAAPQLAAPALINPLSSPAAVASIGAPPAPGSVAAQTAGLVVPQGATPQPGVAAPAPAQAAPTPAPGAPAAVLPPLPPAPKPKVGNTGLTAEQAQTIRGQLASATTSDDMERAYAKIQAYRDQNDKEDKEYEQAVYTRTEKAQADRRADAAAAETVKQHRLEEAHRQAEFARNQANDHLAQVQRDFTNGHTTEAAKRAAEAHAVAMAKAASDAADAANPYHGKDHNSAILWRGNQTGGDTSTQEYADAYRAKKFQTAPNGAVIQVDLPWKPPTGKGAETVKPPTFVAQPSDAARNEVRKADVDAKIITEAIDRYVGLHEKQGGGSWDAYFANPQSPEAQQLLGAFDRMKTTLRSPVYYNTGVLQPAEMELLKQDLISPQTLRGVFATPQAMAARLGEIKLAILTRQDQELRSIGLPGSIVRNDEEFDALPPGTAFYDRNGNKRQKPGGK